VPKIVSGDPDFDDAAALSPPSAAAFERQVQLHEQALEWGLEQGLVPPERAEELRDVDRRSELIGDARTLLHRQQLPDYVATELAKQENQAAATVLIRMRLLGAVLYPETVPRLDAQIGDAAGVDKLPALGDRAALLLADLQYLPALAQLEDEEHLIGGRGDL
jgi:hypothetical protein